MSCLRVACHGFARAGKDEFGAELAKVLGLQRVAIGDLIKGQLDPLIRQHLGFSAFTEVDEEKAQIRETLVRWGYSNYRNILAEFMASLPERAINTRIFRKVEAEAWVEAGGVVWEIQRPGFEAVEPMEGMELELCREAGLIHRTFVNDGTLEEWRRLARRVAVELGSAEGGLREHPERFGAVLAGAP